LNIIDTFGDFLKKELEKDPAKARRMLGAGYRAFEVFGKVHPDRQLTSAQRYVAGAVMDVIIDALNRPDRSAMCSLFVPGEPMTAAGITPYSVEALSCFLAGTHIEKIFLDKTDELGIPETMCSFHRVFLGAAESRLMPQPKFLIYTNLACDGNMMTFPYLKSKYNIPSFFIDVPYEKNKDSVHMVAQSLKEMTVFLQDVTHKTITADALRKAVVSQNQSSADYRRHLSLLQNAALTTHMTSDMYGIFMARILAGSKATAEYTKRLVRDAQSAASAAASGKRPLRIAWVHLMPFMQPSLRELFNYSDRLVFTASDIVYDGFRIVDPADPYEAMAKKLVYSAFNGDSRSRIECARKMAKETNAEGVIVFTHWGCKTTIGASGLIRDALEADGIPVLVLDGDGCNPANSSDGQLVTRVEAFLEMLEEKRQ
jgi:benzoyl-CoA reductase/2-hydroxyglutaryl-CoA dehydratase subunit BcrC/BadD/HgdB